jgi:tetratricopeptide (TPR) repeat protein
VPLLAATEINAAATNASAGWAAYEGGHFEEAKALMSSAVRMSPNHADYQAALSVIELKIGDQTDAIRHLKIAIRLKPSDAEYRLRLASIYQLSNNDLGALRVLQGTAVDANLRGTWHFTRGFSLFRIGRFESARNEFEPLVTDPQFTAPANFFLGNIAFSENRFQDASQYFERAIRLGNSEANTAYNAYTYNYGLALFRLGRYREAEEQFDASVARYDRDPLPWMFIGRCEQELGNYKSAIEMLEKSIQVDPSFGLAYYELARLQKKYGNPERAAELFEAIGRMKQEEIAAEERRAARLQIGEAQR